MIGVAVRETVTRAVGRRSMQPNLLRADGGTDELPCDEVWESVHDIGYSHHFTRWLAVVELEHDDVWPINSSTVKRHVKAMTGADTEPNRQSVLRSMERFRDLGALEREEIEDEPGYHWRSTERGRRLGRAITIQWCEALGCPEAAEALRACADDDSTDSDE